MLAAVALVDSELAEAGRQLFVCHDEAHAVLAAPDVRLAVRSNSAHAVQTLAGLLAPYLNTVNDANSKASSDVSDEAQVVVEAQLASRITAVTDGLGINPNSERSHHSGWHLARKHVSTGEGRHIGHALWHQEDPQTTHVVVEDSGQPNLTLLHRMIRAIATRRLLDSGWVPLHAACVMTHAGAVCLVGRRGRGKTTAALAALQAGARFMANDRVFIAAHPHGGFTARALPFSAGIRPPSVSLFPALTRLVDERPDLYPAGTDASADSSADPRVSLPPRILAETFGTTVVPAAPLHAVIQIDHRQGRQSSRHRTLDPPGAQASLRDAHLVELLPDDEYELARLDAEATRLRATHEELLEHAAQRVPVALLETSHPGSDEFLRALAHTLDR